MMIVMIAGRFDPVKSSQVDQRTQLNKYPFKKTYSADITQTGSWKTRCWPPSPHPRTNVHQSDHCSGANLTLPSLHTRLLPDSRIITSASCAFARGGPSQDRQGSTGPEYAIHGSSEMRPEAQIADSAEIPALINRPANIHFIAGLFCEARRSSHEWLDVGSWSASTMTHHMGLSELSYLPMCIHQGWQLGEDSKLKKWMTAHASVPPLKLELRRLLGHGPDDSEKPHLELSR